MRHLFTLVTMLCFGMGLHAQTWAGDTLCAGESGYVHVVPVPGQTYAWYDAPTGGTLLGSTDTLFTGPLSSTTTYYLQVTTGIPETYYTVGPANNGIASGSNYSYYPDGLVFTVLDTVEIDTVFLYPSGPGNIVVNLKNSSGAVLQTTTVGVSTTGKTPIPLHFCVNPGVGYRMDLVGTSVPSVFRNTGGATYPYNSAKLNITGAINGSTTFYYFFYDWKLSSVCGTSSVVRHPVTVQVNPLPTVNIGPDRTICSGQAVNLVSALAGTHLWSDGSTGATLLVSAPGTYWVQGTDSMGCSASDTVNVSVITPMVPTLAADTILCVGQTLTTCVQTPLAGTNYSWNTGATGACITLNSAGSYVVTGVDSFGCAASDTIQVDSLAVPTAAFTIDTTDCPNIAFTDNSAGQVDDWLWDFGDGNMGWGPMVGHTYGANGLYTITYLVGNACGQDQTTVQLEIDCLVGIEGAIAQPLEVYPNPSHGSFSIRLPQSASPWILQLHDATGKVITQERLPETTREWQLTLEIPAGIYFLHLESSDRHWLQRLVVE